jgi:hypothetical protein
MPAPHGADPAETIRTLLAGHLPGQAHVPRWPTPLTARYVTDPTGHPLLLVGYRSPMAEALRTTGDADATAVALGVADVPPPGAPSLGRAWVSGWARPLAGPDATAAALEFAAVRPTADLLLLGRGYVLYRVEVAEVRLARETGTVRVDPARYAAAEPDPMHPLERALLDDLADHHRGELAAMLHRLVPDAHTCGAIVTPVRLDRYGMLVDLADPTAAPSAPPRRLRIAFPAPLTDPYELITLLRPTPARGGGSYRHERQ